MVNFNFVDVQQNSDEWFQLRAGKLTSSNLGKIMANFGKAFGEPAKKYAINIATEILTGQPINSDYTNDHMQRGHEQEPVARMLYEQNNFCDVLNGGFFESDFIGCSPDGLVSDCGIIEIKSVIPTTHFANIKRQSVDPAYKWQCIGNMYFTGRDWIDFVSYCEAFPHDKRLFVVRMNKDDFNEQFKMLDTRINEFKKLVDECVNTINKSNYFNY